MYKKIRDFYVKSEIVPAIGNIIKIKSVCVNNS